MNTNFCRLWFDLTGNRTESVVSVADAEDGLDRLVNENLDFD